MSSRRSPSAHAPLGWGAPVSTAWRWGDGEQLKRITALIEAGDIRPVLDRTFAFADLNAAFAYIETGRAKGKVVVTVKEDAQ